jgi:hypothetical protein
VDQRADIWAFGCVLFEMITARRAFPGDETPDVLARVIQGEPDWKLIPASTPPAIVTLLHRCLRKDPARRLHSIADARIDLDDVAAGTLITAAPGAAPARSPWTLGLTAVAASAITAGAMLTLSPADPPPDPAAVLRFSLPMPDGWTLFRTLPNGRLNFAISPDGQKLAVAAMNKASSRRILVRRLDEAAFRELPGTDGAGNVFWAPDSQRLAFSTGGGIRRTDLSGAGSQPMVNLQGFGGLAWNQRDEFLAPQGAGNPLVRWSAAGGLPQPIGELTSGALGQMNPAWLPDNEGFMFLEVKGQQAYSLRIQSARRQTQTLAEIESQGPASVTAAIASGHVLLSRVETTGRGILTAQRLDLSTLRLSGNASALATDINPTFSVSENGVLVYSEGRFTSERLYWVDARGVVASTATGPIQIVNFDLSPDERSLVMQVQGGGLQLHDLGRGVTTPLNSFGVDPVWSADGKQVAFAVAGSKLRGLWVMPAFGGTPRRVYEPSTLTYLDGWSRDGAWLAGHVGGSAGPGILIPLAEGGKPILFEDNSKETGVDEARFSPDGRWLAYSLATPSSVDTFLIPLPPTGERWRVSVAGGVQPRWRADGRALYFLSMSGTMMMVDFEARAGAPPQISAPRALFETGIQVLQGFDQFAVNRDGTRFLIRRLDDRETMMQNRLQVIVNWPGLLKKTQ